MTPRVKAVLDMRLSRAGGSAWIFSAQTKSGHIEPSSVKKQHPKAIAEGTRILREETREETAQLAPFELYSLRHTRLTRWAPHMDPWTLAYLAGHRDMNITKRYIHPQEQTIRAAMEKARGERAVILLGIPRKRRIWRACLYLLQGSEMSRFRWCAQTDSNCRPSGS